MPNKVENTIYIYEYKSGVYALLWQAEMHKDGAYATHNDQYLW